MKKITPFLCFMLVLLTNKTFSQPYVDIVSFNCQTFSSTYRDKTKWKNKTDDYFLNFFLPKEFKNGNTLLIRLNSEMISSTFTPDSSYTSKLYNVSMPLGFQFLSKNKKWKTVLITIPKIASDLTDVIDKKDFQLGGIFLENYVHSEKLKIKAGLYYNREAFGNFFMPLVGLDWKVSDRLNLYGILPTSYKVEYAFAKNKLYAGVNFRSLTRSFRLSKAQNLDYVRYNEIQLKLFVDYFIYKKVLIFGELGYSVGKNPWQYTYNTKIETLRNPVYTPLKSYPVLNIGVAYRIRLDLEKRE
jgi:outer membrane receptor protein involved in Fe transport